jgi:hypothetical protein
MLNTFVSIMSYFSSCLTYIPFMHILVFMCLVLLLRENGRFVVQKWSKSTAAFLFGNPLGRRLSRLPTCRVRGSEEKNWNPDRPVGNHSLYWVNYSGSTETENEKCEGTELLQQMSMASYANAGDDVVRVRRLPALHICQKSCRRARRLSYRFCVVHRFISVHIDVWC